MAFSCYYPILLLLPNPTFLTTSLVSGLMPVLAPCLQSPANENETPSALPSIT